MLWRQCTETDEQSIVSIKGILKKKLKKSNRPTDQNFHILVWANFLPNWTELGGLPLENQAGSGSNPTEKHRFGEKNNIAPRRALSCLPQVSNSHISALICINMYTIPVELRNVTLVSSVTAPQATCCPLDHSSWTCARMEAWTTFFCT